MQNPAKHKLTPILQAIPILLIAIVLVILPFFLLESHPHTKIHSSPHPQSYRFSSDQIIAPISQNQNLRYINLPNSVQALLISDPDTPKSGCSIQMKAGSTDEPKEINGLAHFLEHMLFQGSAKYPANDYFDDFLSRNNGQTNAFTTDTATIFYFDIDNSAFVDALDIFSHFFIDAKLDSAAVEREIYAVNNEYQIDLQKNDWRFMELLKKLSNKENPYHRFTIGNYKTLKTIPESMNLSLYSELKKFYETHYTAEKMTVCVISNESLDHIESIVTEKFHKVPRRNALENNTNFQNQNEFKENAEVAWNFMNLNLKQLKRANNDRKKKESNNGPLNSINSVHFDENHWNFLKLRSQYKLKEPAQQQQKTQYPSAFTPKDLGKFVWYKTLGGSQELSLVFIMNFTVVEDSFTKTWDYLTELISNDYPTGFKNYLIGKGLINNIDAGIQVGLDFFMYIVKFDLTSDGFNSMLDLINNVFAILGFISNQGISQNIYNEKSLISYINFLYSQKEDLDDELTDLLQQMGQDIKNLYVSGKVYMKYDERIMRYLVSQLQPSNSLIVIGNGDFQFSESVEKVAFKTRESSFRQNNDTIESRWEIYDDFMKEIHEDPTNYRLKTINKRQNSSTLSQNETKLMKIIKKSLVEKKDSKGLLNLKWGNQLCKKHNKAKKWTGSGKKQSNDNDSINSMLYSKKLNKLDEQMKVYYRVESIDQIQMAKFSSFISNFSGILPQDLTIYETNPYIPNDLSLVDNICISSTPLSKAQALQQRLLVVSNFTDPINTLIQQHLNSADINNSNINSSCFEAELSKDKEFKLPEQLKKASNINIEAWYKTSREFNLPQVQINLVYHYPTCGLESLMVELFSKKLKMVLDSELVDAKIIGYNIDINTDSVGLNVQLQGFHDKIEDLVKLFGNKLKNVTIEQQEYEGIKMLFLLQDALGISFDSIGPQDEVIQQAELILKLALLGSDNSSYATYLRDSDYGIFQKAFEKFKKEAKLKVLFFGNILENDATKLLSYLESSFSFLGDNSTTINRSCVPSHKDKFLKLPDDVGLVYRTKNLNNDDENHAIINYYQFGIANRSSVLKTEAFSQTFNLKAFDFLRTANQLGYVVMAQPIFLNQVLGIAVFIQGSKKNPFEMDGLIEDFLKFFEEYLNNIDESNVKEELENIEYEIFTKRNKGFSGKSNAYWNEIYEGNYDFEKKSIKEILKDLKKIDILEFYNNVMKNKQKKLSIQVWGNNETIVNETLSNQRNYAGKNEKLIDGFDNLDQYIVTDNKLKFYDQLL